MTTTTVNPIEKIFGQYEMLKEAEETLKAEIESVRSDIKDIVEEHGGKFNGYGWDAAMAAESVSISYDAKTVERVIAALMASGNADLAQTLVGGRKIMKKASYLRVAKQR
jgi:hypothetical protein